MLGFAIVRAAQATESWSIVVLPDTQLYSNSSITPQVGTNFTSDSISTLNAMLDWIVSDITEDNAHNIQLVLHEGDIVHLNKPDEWASKKSSFARLDGVVPYLLATGNHDYSNGTPTNRTTLYNDYFSLSDNYLNNSLNGVVTIQKDANKLENSYATFTAPDGRKVLVFNLEFGPRQEVVDWANAIAHRDEFKDYTAILLTHSYLEEYQLGTNIPIRNNWTPGEGSLHHNPHYWASMFPQLGTVHDGQELWDELVSVHSSFEIVLNGHHGHKFGSVNNIGAAKLHSTRPNKPTVHQMYFNAQFTSNTPGKYNGGEGYLRLLTFLHDGKTVRVKTYSPTEDNWVVDEHNQFDFELTQVSSDKLTGEEYSNSIYSTLSNATDFMFLEKDGCDAEDLDVDDCISPHSTTMD